MEEHQPPEADTIIIEQPQDRHRSQEPIELMNKDIVQEVIVSMEATMSIYNLHELGNGSIQELLVIVESATWGQSMPLSSPRLSPLCRKPTKLMRSKVHNE